MGSEVGFALEPAQVFTAPGAIRRYLERHRLCPYLLIHERLEPEFAGLPRGEPNAVVLGDAGVAPGEALIVGDDVECDVAAAMRVGLQACLVRSGKYRPGD